MHTFSDTCLKAIPQLWKGVTSFAHSGDQALSARAAQGDPEAIRELDELCAPLVRALLGTIRIPGCREEEARQLVRERLLLGPNGSGKISQYRGRGALKNWLRVVIARVLLNRAATQIHELPFEEEILARFLGTGNDVELAYMKQLYTNEFRTAFRQALKSLDDRERLLLRLSFLECLTIDDLARLNGVHRATVARQIVRAEQALFEAVRTNMQASLGIDDAEFASILRLVKSRLEITFDALRESSTSPSS